MYGLKFWLLAMYSIDDFHSLVQSSSLKIELKIYGDNVALYAAVSSCQDFVDLQSDLSHIYDSDRSLRWQLKLSPSKCEALNITNKRYLLPITLDQFQ